jgi:DNA-binding MarR family transcriptional regulator
MGDSDLDRDSLHFWTLVFQIILDGEKRLAAHLAAHELTPPQFYVLKTLSERGGHCAIGQIARDHHLTNATMTGLIKRLEAMNPPLVKREPSKSDRRSVEVNLTPAGQARFLAVQADFLNQVRLVFRLLSERERQDLLHYLERYVNVLAEQFPVDAIQPRSDDPQT